MSKIDRLIQKAIDKLDKEGKRAYDSNILIKMRELSDGEVTDIVNDSERTNRTTGKEE